MGKRPIAPSDWNVAFDCVFMVKAYRPKTGNWIPSGSSGLNVSGTVHHCLGRPLIFTLISRRFSIPDKTQGWRHVIELAVAHGDPFETVNTPRVFD
jgi:hypothetical protein